MRVGNYQINQLPRQIMSRGETPVILRERAVRDLKDRVRLETWKTNVKGCATLFLVVIPRCVACLSPVGWNRSAAATLLIVVLESNSTDQPHSMKSSALLPATREMREWSSILGQEMMRWPGVRVSHVFGTLAFHHRKVMFAMLPDRRSLDSSTAISFREYAREEKGQYANWRTFELADSELVKTALFLLEKAYKDSVLHPFSNPLRSSSYLSVSAG